MSDTLVFTSSTMGTVVTFQVVGHDASRAERRERTQAVQRAMGWFEQINAACTRFNPQSELSLLTRQVGKPVVVSPLLYQAVRFALAVAEESNGAFDPTVGQRMEARGFNREDRTGAMVATDIAPDTGVSYRDVRIDAERQTITLLRPLLLDLGAVAKGLAVDLAAQELQRFTDFAIDAGGDLYLGGHNDEGNQWSVGIRHPREPRKMITTLQVTNRAVCTSGDYERRSPTAEAEHHIVDPRTGRSPAKLASATVLAPTAMVADALATAAFVLGPTDGLDLLKRQGVDGLLVTPTLETFMTQGMHVDSRA